jgi:hypothetical protein
MKNWLASKLLTLSVLVPASMFAQIAENLKNLEGRWYEETRHSITYTTWQDMGNQNRFLQFLG